MIFFENFRIAFKAIFANKMRSVLTTLGIIIGVAAVVGVVAIVQGLSFMISNQLQGVGATYITVGPEYNPNNPDLAGKDIRLTLEDAEAIRRECPAIATLTPTVYQFAWVSAAGRKWSGIVIGVNEEYPDIENHYVEEGRFISAQDIEARRRVVVIGQTFVDELKLGSNPMGREVVIGGNPFTVVGVTEKKGKTLGRDRDAMALIPYTTAEAVFGETISRQMEIDMRARSAEVVDAAKDQIKETLRKRHHIAEGKADDFRIFTQEEILATVGKILGNVTMVVAAIVGIALLVGGIGIMNIMLVSVTERTKEIGLRKAVGARRRDILIQFLIEAVALSLVGGAIGIMLGYGLGMLGANLIPDFPAAHVPLWAIFLALGFAGSVGVFFGIYPAAKASRLHPIEALRYE